MLQEAVTKGVSRESLAKALNIDITSLLKKLKLPVGIRLNGTAGQIGLALILE